MQGTQNILIYFKFHTLQSQKKPHVGNEKTMESKLCQNFILRNLKANLCSSCTTIPFSPIQKVIVHLVVPD